MSPAVRDPIIELGIPVDRVRAPVDPARGVQTRSDPALSDDEDADPDGIEPDAPEDRGADPAELEFRTLVEALPDDAQSDLVAPMWPGRADGDWPKLWILANERRKTPAFSCLGATPPVAGHLGAGRSGLESRAGDSRRDRAPSIRRSRIIGGKVAWNESISSTLDMSSPPSRFC